MTRTASRRDSIPVIKARVTRKLNGMRKTADSCKSGVTCQRGNSQGNVSGRWAYCRSTFFGHHRTPQRAQHWICVSESQCQIYQLIHSVGVTGDEGRSNDSQYNPTVNSNKRKQANLIFSPLAAILPANATAAVKKTTEQILPCQRIESVAKMGAGKSFNLVATVGEE